MSESETQAGEEERMRVEAVERRRMYFRGEQYDELNANAAEGFAPPDRLPEEDRLHAYSTHIEEAVTFIADQLASNFAVEAEDAAVQAIIDNALRLSDQITGSNDEDDIAIDGLLTDAMVAMDVAVEMRWDPVEESTYYDLWDSENVRFDYADRRTLERVTRTEKVWVIDREMGDSDNGERQVDEDVVYELAANGQFTDDDGESVPIMECRRRVFWDDPDRESPRDTTWLGVPFIPWTLVRCDGRKLRGIRGESIISNQCMGHADRYNATMQVGYQIARTNSHSNMVIVGDAAHLQLLKDGELQKDVDDVPTFPGGTAVHQVTLPTDMGPMELQRKVLIEAMFNSFGLTRVDPETIQGLGGVTGYSLEILNRKSDGRFRRIRRHIVRDLRNIFAMTLDWHAYHVGSPVEDDEDEGDTDPGQAPFWTVDPDAMFANRRVEIRMGTGYVVDTALIRDDFLSKLISRREALRQRGRREDDIDEIEREIEDEKGEPLELGTFGPSASKTKAGDTVGNTDRTKGEGDGQ